MAPPWRPVTAAVMPPAPSTVLATVQTSISPDVRANGRRVRTALERAAAAGARIVHFPEGALSGYVKAQVRNWDAVDWAAVDDELMATAVHAADCGLWAVIGCNHRLPPPDRPQNSLYVLSDRGTIAARYAKRICSNTEITSWYTLGTDPIVFDVDGIRFGCALCIEVCFPPLFALYERQQAHCVLLSAYSADPMHGVMARAHAATNCYWVSLSTPTACSGSLPSTLIGPDGHLLATAAAGTDDMILTTIDLGAPTAEIPLQRARPWRALALARWAAREIDRVPAIDSGQ